MTQAVCGYYGKLPLSPEFLRLHAAGPELRWLDEWFQQGTLYAKAQEGTLWEARLIEATPCSFFYVPAGEGRIVSGVVVASRDKAGRSFPFLSFVLLDRSLFAASPWLLPIAMAPFLTETAESIRLLRMSLDWSTFCQEIETRLLSTLTPEQAADLLTNFARSTTGDAWGLGSPIQGNVVALPPMLQRATWIDHPASHSIRFLIPQSESTQNLDLSVRLQRYLQPAVATWDERTGLLCLWNRGTEQNSGSAVLSIGPGSPNVVRFIVNPLVQDNAWQDVTIQTSNVGSDQSAGATSMRCLIPQVSTEQRSPVVRRRLGRAWKTGSGVEQSGFGGDLAGLGYLTSNWIVLYRCATA